MKKLLLIHKSLNNCVKIDDQPRELVKWMTVE